MTAQQRAELYQLTRMLWWRHELGQLSDEALEALLNVLNGARQEIVKKIRAELESLVSVSEWRKDYDQQVMVWLNEVTAAARGTVTSLITETSIGVALASVETYNSILSFEGAAKSVKLVSGLTRDQVRQFFVDQPLGGRLLSEWVDRSFTSGAQQLMLDAIRAGVMQGESYRKLERRVMDAAAQGFGITQREAATLVRTYVQSANTGAQEAVYKQNEDIIRGYKRVETLDNHTCRICALMDGAKYGLHEKKPDLPAHPNCVVGEMPVFAPDYVAAFVSTYRGPVFEIIFANGARVTATGNHMFLTDKGFSPAKSLNKGENVFCGSAKIVSSGSFCPYDDRQPTRIDKIVDTFSESKGVSSVRVPASPKYLHGDGEFCQGYIDIIAPECLLRGDYETFFHEFLGEDFFSKALDNTFPFNTKRYFPPMFFGMWLASNCHMSGRSILDVFLSGSSGHHQPVSFCIPPNGDILVDKQRTNNCFSRIVTPPQFLHGLSSEIKRDEFISRNTATNFPCRETNFMKSPDNSVDGDSEFMRHLGETLVGKIPFAQVVQVNVRDFFGHVYDLQTISTLYQVNGMVTSNCRGVYLPLLKSFRELGLDMDEFEDVARPWAIRGTGNLGTSGAKIEEYGTSKEDFHGWLMSLPEDSQLKTSIGPVRLRLLKEGKVSWDELSNKQTGLPYTLKELGFDEQGNPL